MSDTYSSHLDESRRLCILRLIDRAPGCALNDSVMQTVLTPFGFPVSRDKIRGDFAWLAEQGLLTVEILLGRLYVATITERGLDVVAGRVVVPGVQRPSPG